MNKIKGIIFDLDGTLLDTLDDIMDAGNKVLEKLGIEKVEKEKYKEFIGDGIKELFSKLLNYRNAFSEENLIKSVELMKEEYSKRYLNKTKPYEGIYDLLDYLEKKETKMAILSNKQHLFTKELVKFFFGKYNFIDIKGIEKPEDRKPNPKLALEIISNMKLNNEEVCLIGDSKTDILTAKNCKIISIGVTWGFKGIKELKEAEPSILVDKPEEIIKFLELGG
ncbi:MAG: HAD family hydrolase [Thermoprotei archaeon]|jgi:phosphoglycolate phosphatase